MPCGVTVAVRARSKITCIRSIRGGSGRVGSHGSFQLVATECSDTKPACLVSPTMRSADDPTLEVLPVMAMILEAVEAVPCDVFLVRGGRPVLFATAGAVTQDILAGTRRDVPFHIRTEDSELFRRSLARSVPRLLADPRLSPAERSRRAYGVIAQIMASIFSPKKRVDRAGLADAGRAVDAITDSLGYDSDLIWAFIGTMSKGRSMPTHAINTAVYAVLLAGELGVVDDAGGDIGRGALLHDIGKNRIPPGILDKPGPLDEEEWRVMRSLPRVGRDLIVRAIGSEPSYARIIGEHHERADGSGYPAPTCRPRGRPGKPARVDRGRVRRADLGPLIQAGRFILRSALDDPIANARAVRPTPARRVRRHARRLGATPHGRASDPRPAVAWDLKGQIPAYCAIVVSISATDFGGMIRTSWPASSNTAIRTSFVASSTEKTTWT